jgi:PAS domain-containing protein
VATFHSDDGPRYVAAVARAADPAGPGTLNEEFRIRRPDGQERWMSVSATTTFEGALPVAARMTGVLADVTDRKRAEERLRESEERQAFLLRLADALRPLANPAEGEACRLLGEHLGVEGACYVDLDEAAGVARVERDFVRGPGPSLAGEHPVAAVAGSVAILRRGHCHVVADTQASPLAPPENRPASAALGIVACIGAPLIKEGRLVGALCVADARPWEWAEGEVDLLRDVAERIWGAVERARVEAALRESEARLAAALESVPVGVSVVDASGAAVLSSGAAVLSNAEFQRFLPNGVIPSRDPARVGRWQAWDAQGRPLEPHDFPDALALQGERVVPSPEMIRTDDEGWEAWAGVSAAPIRDEAGRVAGLVTVISDIDAAKRSADVMRESEERLREFGKAPSDVL